MNLWEGVINMENNNKLLAYSESIITRIKVSYSILNGGLNDLEKVEINNSLLKINNQLNDIYKMIQNTNQPK